MAAKQKAATPDPWAEMESTKKPGAEAAHAASAAHAADMMSSPDKMRECEARAEQKLMHARSRLAMKTDLYAHGYILTTVRMTWDWTISTACCDGARIRFNPAFVDFLSLRQVAYVVLHEGEHLLGLHVHRADRASVDHQLANIAMDVVINGTLSSWAGISDVIEDPPFGCWHPRPDFWNRAWEEVYADLLRGAQQQEGGGGQGKGKGDGQPGIGDVGRLAKDAPGQQDAQANVIAAVEAARMAGKLPGHLSKIVEDLTDSGVDWVSLVRQYMTERARECDENTWSPPNRRFIGRGEYLPALREGIRLGKVLIQVDASGSTWNDEIMSKFKGALQAFVDDCRPEELVVLYWDTQYQGHAVFQAGDDIVLEPKGGGGTDFAGVWDWVGDNLDTPPVFAAVLTDLCVGDFGKEPGYPVLWVTYGNPGAKAPFGETIEANE